MKPSIVEFRKRVLTYYSLHKRNELPWRKTRDPYKILVSEIMLQQTQVDRVIPYFKRFITKFPTVQALSRAPLEMVLREWSGLGYNRRAKLLRECAKEMVEKHGGTIPNDRPALVALPAIGLYTAGAIRTFAFNEPDVFIETNIRAALIHHFFPNSKRVDDKKLIPILDTILKDTITYAYRHTLSGRSIDARTWYSALMDYGAHIKKTNPNPSRRSKHHTRQSPFQGSLRQYRGIILRRLLSGPIPQKSLLKVDTEHSYFLELALKDLEREKMIIKKKGKWWIA